MRTPSRAATRRLLRLTARETDVVELVARGLTNAEIGRRLGLGRPTVARILASAMGKVGLERRAQLAALVGRDLVVEGLGETGAMPPDARALLSLLAEGVTLGEAAERLGMARRTADRRLAQARSAIGAERTTEAIALARRAGIVG